MIVISVITVSIFNCALTTSASTGKDPTLFLDFLSGDFAVSMVIFCGKKIISCFNIVVNSTVVNIMLNINL